MSNRHITISKFLSLLLRHTPERVRLALDGDGFQFFLSANSVWLTEHVPSAYIEFDSSEVVTAPQTA